MYQTITAHTNEKLLKEAMDRRICERPSKYWDSITTAENSVYQTGDLIVDRYAKTIYKKGKCVGLTATEYEIALYLIDNVTLTCPKDAVRNMLRIRFRREISDNTLSKHIGHLRSALGQDVDQEYILTRRSIGYKWNLPVAKRYIRRQMLED